MDRFGNDMKSMEQNRYPAGEKGATIVEFALVCMVVLTLLFGIIDFGRALYTYHFVSYAARQATRYAMVNGSDTTSPITAAGVTTYVNGLVPAGINAANLTVTTTWPTDSNYNTCPTAGSEKPGCPVKVQVQYNFKFLLPYLPTFTWVMTSTSEMAISW